jgi:hypothetical protein
MWQNFLPEEREFPVENFFANNGFNRKSHLLLITWTTKHIQTIRQVKCHPKTSNANNAEIAV